MNSSAEAEGKNLRFLVRREDVGREKPWNISLEGHVQDRLPGNELMFFFLFFMGIVLESISINNVSVARKKSWKFKNNLGKK